jgi:tetratricopeptide (TPR) repeat protein
MEIKAAQGYLEKVKADSPKKKPIPASPRPILRYPRRETAPPLQPYNRKALLSAEKAWNQALQSQPDRLDLALELSEVERSLGRFESQYALLAQALQKNDQNPESWRWIPGEEMPGSPQSLLSNSLLESEAFYLNQGLGQSAKVSRLARLAMTFNSQDPLPYNALAVNFQFQGNAPSALKYLLLAFKRDSDNCLVLGNIGRLLESLGKKREARIYFNRVVSLNKDPDETVEAKKYLNKGE